MFNENLSIMETIKIKCPHCNTKFPINESDSLWTSLKKSVSHDMDELIQQQKVELKKKQDEYQELLKTKINETKLSVAEEHRLEVMQKEKLVSDLKKQLDVAKHKIEQNSSQLIGEVQELRLEEILTQNFVDEFGDILTPVAKGKFGVDCHLDIVANSIILGRISFESKNTRSFSKLWIKKAKEGSMDSQVCIIVTKAMPKGCEDERFVIQDGIFICRMDFVLTLTRFLRYSVCSISRLKLQYKGKAGKEHLLFSYITSPEYENLSKSCLKKLEDLKVNMDKEKKALVKAYTEREVEITKAITSLMGYFGNINGIVAGESITLPKAG